MPIVDLFAALFILASLVTGFLIVRAVRQKQLAENPAERIKRLRERGSHNAEIVETEAELVCEACQRPVNPDVDVFSQARWWHVTCYKEVTKV